MQRANGNPHKQHRRKPQVDAVNLDSPDRITYGNDSKQHPRVSLILPTGNPEKGLGRGAWGVQGNLPLSVEPGDRWRTHWNLGATFFPA